MNKENIDKVIAVIEDEGNFFSMMAFGVDPTWWNNLANAVEHYGQPVPSCKTPACIAGWAATLAGGKAYQSGLAAEFLGFPGEFGEGGATPLFYPEDETGRQLNWRAITREEAIATLRHLRDTGEVVWNVSEAARNAS